MDYDSIMNTSSKKNAVIQSAGYVIVDFSGVEPTALCLLDNFNQWDFPKGHVERKETVHEAAVRETEEECGLGLGDFQPSEFFASTAPYNVPRGSKVATYFFAERLSNSKPYLPVNPQLGHPEHISLSWFPVSQLHKRMPKRLAPVIDKLTAWVEGRHQDSGMTSENF